MVKFSHIFTDLQKAFSENDKDTHAINYNVKTAMGVYSAWHFLSFQELGMREASAVVCDTGAYPALGGIRLMPPGISIKELLHENCTLAEAMGEKNFLAGLPNAGAKFCLVSSNKSRDELLWFGRCVKWLGKIFAATDVGTTQEDLIIMAETGAPFIAALPEERGGSGDSSVPTAFGVHSCIEAYCKSKKRSLNDAVVVIYGMGKVGKALTHRLSLSCKELRLSDLPEMKEGLKNYADFLKHGAKSKIKTVPHDEALSQKCDILAPCCGPGGIINKNNIADLKCLAIIGSTNNTLHRENALEDAQNIHSRGIDWIPDTLSSLGGVVNIAVEAEAAKAGVPYDQNIAYQRISCVKRRTLDLLSRAQNQNNSPYEVMKNDIARRITLRKTH